MTQALPLLCSLVCIIYAFKFSILAGLNPGSITTLFSLNSIYVSVLFYFYFDEVLGATQMIGIVMMLVCAYSLSFDNKSGKVTEEAAENMDLTMEEMRQYGIMAISTAFVGPLFWSYRSYHAKKAF